MANACSTGPLTEGAPRHHPRPGPAQGLRSAETLPDAEACSHHAAGAIHKSPTHVMQSFGLAASTGMPLRSSVQRPKLHTLAQGHLRLHLVRAKLRFLLLQAHCRAFLAKRLARRHRAARLIQSRWRGLLARRAAAAQVEAAVLIQTRWRGAHARAAYQRSRRSIILVRLGHPTNYQSWRPCIAAMSAADNCSVPGS